MWSRILRKGIPALLTLVLLTAFSADAAHAAGGFYMSAGLRGNGLAPYRPAYGVLAVGFGYGYHGHPLDDSYDHPYGYGEYAEYGPWAYRGYGSAVCRLAQLRVQTAYGLRWRTIRICN